MDIDFKHKFVRPQNEVISYCTGVRLIQLFFFVIF